MIVNILVFVFVFLTGLLWHELMHIKSQGLRATGQVDVGVLSMSSYVSYMNNATLFFFAGGILTSLVMFTMAVIAVGSIFHFSFLTNGWIHLIYGLYEGTVSENVRWQRYSIYVGVTLINLLLWILIT